MSLQDNIRNNVLVLMENLFHGITIANGYNTQPRVCASWAEANEAQEQCRLWVVVGAERFEEMQVSGRQTASVEMLVYSIVSNEGGDMQQQSNALLQDVRNILSRSRKSIRDLTGATFVGFDACETDEGQLSNIGRVLWVQPVVFTYVAGNDW